MPPNLATTTPALHGAYAIVIDALHPSVRFEFVLRFLIGFAVVAVVAVAVATNAATPAHGASVRELPLGAVSSATGVDPRCPQEATCQAVVVRCPGVSRSARAFLAVELATASKTRGVVVFFSGARGTSYWSTSGGRRSSATPTESFLATLRRDGFITIQVRWDDAWLVAPAGEQPGPARLACRPASVIKWVYQRFYVPLGLSPKVGRCGFCITGNSGGATQVSYALSHYGLDEIVDMVIPSGGPPHAALVKGCLADDPLYRFAGWAAAVIDASYGITGDDGPCSRKDASFLARWREDAVDTGGSDYRHLKTRVAFVFGEYDESGGPTHGNDYLRRLRAAGSPLVSLVTVPGMGHGIARSPDGLSVVRNLLLR